MLKTCVICGGEFDHVGAAKACSVACRSERKLLSRRAGNKAWREANREKHNARVNAWKRANPETIRKRNAKWRDETSAKAKAYDALIAKLNAEINQGAQHAYRATT